MANSDGGIAVIFSCWFSVILLFSSIFRHLDISSSCRRWILLLGRLLIPLCCCLGCPPLIDMFTSSCSILIVRWRCGTIRVTISSSICVSSITIGAILSSLLATVLFFSCLLVHYGICFFVFTFYLFEWVIWMLFFQSRRQ